MTEVQTSYREQLRGRFDQRKGVRASYSLRAFARDLGYGAPQLSRVMNGKQHLSVANARTIADRLFESERERDLFVARVELESASGDKAREQAQAKLERARKREFGRETVMLSRADFQVISDWYHLAILCLLEVTGAPRTQSGIARYLGIGKAETREAIERLERLGLIHKEVRADGESWAPTHARLHVPSGEANGAIRKYHRSMIEKGLRAVDSQDVERRYLSARTVGIAPRNIPKFRALIDDFLAKASALSSESGNEHASRLYQINVQMFDLSALPSVTEIVP